MGYACAQCADGFGGESGGDGRAARAGALPDDPDAPYRADLDFAFFAARFGYSREEYGQLTARQRAFLLKAWEDRTVQDATLLRNAVLNALQNALRAPGKPFRPLFRKRAHAEDSAGGGCTPGTLRREDACAAALADAQRGGAWMRRLRGQGAGD